MSKRYHRLTTLCVIIVIFILIISVKNNIHGTYNCSVEGKYVNNPIYTEVPIEEAVLSGIFSEEEINDFMLCNQCLLNNEKKVLISKEMIYPINKNGETYGSGIYHLNLDFEPDLIAAIGIYGIQGYVRASDLNGPEPSNPKEALAMQEKNKGKSRLIPLYDKDGETILDEFRIGSGEK